MQKEELKQQIARAFAKAPYPGDSHIAYHDCPECDDVREAFTGQTPATLPPQTIEYHYESLPLLSPQAHRYFLPAYLFYALDNFDSGVTRYLLFDLSSNWRKSSRGFTRGEREVVADFLHHLSLVDEHAEYHEEIKAALELWETAR